MGRTKTIRVVLALTLGVGAGFILTGCSPDGPTATASPKNHQAAIDAIKNNPHMPQDEKDRAIGRMQQEDKAAGFMPTKK